MNRYYTQLNFLGDKSDQTNNYCIKVIHKTHHIYHSLYKEYKKAIVTKKEVKERHKSLIYLKSNFIKGCIMTTISCESFTY